MVSEIPVVATKLLKIADHFLRNISSLLQVYLIQLPISFTYLMSLGLFMGILVTLVLLAILSVGINAVASLQVSYGAFEKEMGPTAHKQQ